jgi:hypothetical protein
MIDIETDNRLLLGMMKDMQANEARIQISVVRGHGKQVRVANIDTRQASPKPTLDGTVDL